MMSGFDRFQTSGGSPNIRPLANSIVPIAPSAMIVVFPRRGIATACSQHRRSREGRSSIPGTPLDQNGSGSMVGAAWSSGSGHRVVPPAHVSAVAAVAGSAESGQHDRVTPPNLAWRGVAGVLLALALGAGTTLSGRDAGNEPAARDRARAAGGLRRRPVSIWRVLDPAIVAVVHGRWRPDRQEHRRPGARPLDGRPARIRMDVDAQLVRPAAVGRRRPPGLDGRSPPPSTGAIDWSPARRSTARSGRRWSGCDGPTSGRSRPFRTATTAGS